MPTNEYRRNNVIRKSPFGDHFSNNSAKKHQKMLKLRGRILRHGVLYSLQVSAHKMLLNYRGEKSSFTMERSDRPHHKLAEGYTGVCCNIFATFFVIISNYFKRKKNKPNAQKSV